MVLQSEPLTLQSALPQWSPTNVGRRLGNLASNIVFTSLSPRLPTYRLSFWQSNFFTVWSIQWRFCHTPLLPVNLYQPCGSYMVPPPHFGTGVNPALGWNWFSGHPCWLCVQCVQPVIVACYLIIHIWSVHVFLHWHSTSILMVKASCWQHCKIANRILI